MLSEIYNSTNRFLRDALGYLVPGFCMVSLLIFRYSGINNLSITLFLNITKEINVYSFSFFVLVCLISGYIVGAFYSLIPSKIKYFGMSKRFKMIKPLYIVNSELASSFFDIQKTNNPLFSTNNVMQKLGGISISSVKLMHEQFTPNIFSENTIVERLNSQRLMFSGLTIVFIVSSIIYFDWGPVWSAAFLIFGLLSHLNTLSLRSWHSYYSELFILGRYLELKISNKIES